ncbi:MAG: ankyrin repeat domain-containing protein [Vulcanimicrobiota bacterium]
MRWLLLLVVVVLGGCGLGAAQLQGEFFTALEQNREDRALELLKEHPQLVIGGNQLAETNLQLAIANRRARVALALIEAGAPLSANPKAKGKHGKSKGAPPLLLALRQINSADPDHPFRNLAIVIIEKGADVRAQDKSGFTALHHAAGLGDVELVKLLLAKGASKEVKNEEGKTPLDLATGEAKEYLSTH